MNLVAIPLPVSSVLNREEHAGLEDFFNPGA